MGHPFVAHLPSSSDSCHNSQWQGQLRVTASGAHWPGQCQCGANSEAACQSRWMPVEPAGRVQAGRGHCAPPFPPGPGAAAPAGGVTVSAAARLGAARELEAESGRRVTPPAACAHARASGHMMLGFAGYCDHQANQEPASGCGHWNLKSQAEAHPERGTTASRWAERRNASGTTVGTPYADHYLSTGTVHNSSEIDCRLRCILLRTCTAVQCA